MKTVFHLRRGNFPFLKIWVLTFKFDGSYNVSKHLTNIVIGNEEDEV